MDRFGFGMAAEQAGAEDEHGGVTLAQPRDGDVDPDDAAIGLHAAQRAAMRLLAGIVPCGLQERVRDQPFGRMGEFARRTSDHRIAPDADERFIAVVDIDDVPAAIDQRMADMS